MASFTLSGTATDYTYRADGMRVNKSSGTQTMTYGYDGQMGIEECLTDTGTPANDYTTRYGLGARGIDRIETVTTGTAVSYPIYDAHGNMMTTLAKSGSGYTYGTCRYYDAWGGIRSGATTGAPSGRHCANLGHVQDDESGLVYMRARFYEPGTGRFISEDPDMNGRDWYVYCGGSPVSNVDITGRELQPLDLLFGIGQMSWVDGSLGEGMRQFKAHGHISSFGRMNVKGLNKLCVACVAAALVILVISAFTAGAAAIVVIAMIVLTVVLCKLLDTTLDDYSDRMYPDPEGNGETGSGGRGGQKGGELQSANSS